VRHPEDRGPDSGVNWGVLWVTAGHHASRWNLLLSRADAELIGLVMEASDARAGSALKESEQAMTEVLEVPCLQGEGGKYVVESHTA
jgi:hypothetical protein